MHHEGDLLLQAATAAIGRFLPAQEVILRLPPDGTSSPHRWIEAKRLIAARFASHIGVGRVDLDGASQVGPPLDQALASTPV
jgi:hypothetical protein